MRSTRIIIIPTPVLAQQQRSGLAPRLITGTSRSGARRWSAFACSTSPPRAGLPACQRGTERRKPAIKLHSARRHWTGPKTSLTQIMIQHAKATGTTTTTATTTDTRVCSRGFGEPLSQVCCCARAGARVCCCWCGCVCVCVCVCASEQAPPNVRASHTSRLDTTYMFRREQRGTSVVPHGTACAR